MSPRTRTFLQWLLGSLGVLMLLLALLFGAFGFIVGRVPEYRVQLQNWISERSGVVVEFRTLSARLRAYGPELVFDDAVVRTPDRTRVLATASRGSVGFDLWNSLANGRLTAGRFSLESPEIGLIRTKEGRIQLLGQSALPERLDTPFALEQLPTGRFYVHNAVVSFRDEITRRGPWSLSGVSFELTRDSDSMHLVGDASLPRTLGRELEFSAACEGAIEQSATLVSTFSIKGKDLDLAGWADVLPDEWPVPETGHGSLRLSGTLRGAELRQVAAQVDFAKLTSALPVWATPLPGPQPLQPADSGDDGADDGTVAATDNASLAPGPEEGDEPGDVTPPEMLSYERVAFAMRAQKLDDQWSLTLSDLTAAKGDSSWQAKEISARWSSDPNGALKVSGKADRIVLGQVWPLLAYLPESAGLARLRAMHATGTLQDLSVSVARTAPDAAPTYSLEANLDDISFLPVGATPGFGGLGGKLRASDQSGQWQVAGKGVTFELPRMFRDVLTAESVDGVMTWQRNAAGLVINSDEMRVRGADGRAVARLNLTLPNDGTSPVLDLFAQGENLKVGSTRKYIPADKLSAKTLEWFDRAFVDGRVANAEFQYKGPMRLFPFRKDEGLFLARGHVEDAVFDYQPGWQPARGLVADVEFRNEGMHIVATAANIGDVRVTRAVADLPDFRHGNLTIKATAGGDLDNGLKFLRESPIGPKLGDQFARLGGRGPMSADVNLNLPLKHLDDRKIEVVARLSDATVTMQKVSAPVRGLTGELTVRNSLVAAAHMEGQWLGGPLAVTIEPQGASASQLDAKGRANATELQSLLGLPQFVGLNGATDWQMSTQLVSGDGDGKDDGNIDNGRRTVRIDSSLRGLAIGLPEPVGKSEAQERPLQIALEFDGERALLARASLGDLRALVRMKQSADGWSLDRGTVRADAVVPALPGHRGFRIEGSVQRFVLDDWLALRGSSGGGEGKPLSDFLQAANVRVGDFQLFGYRWTDLRGVLQATQSGWRVDVSSPNAAGQVLIPESFTGSQPLRATMERLGLERAKQPDARAQDSQDKPIDPRVLPNMQVYVSDLRVGARNIGAVNLKATRVPQGIRFDNVTIQGQSARAEAHGQWLNTVDGPQSSLNASIESSDVAATLKSLNYTDFMQAKRGAIRADVSWPGGYDENILDHASGGISVDAESGQLVNLQPGAGRVLGLFSVAALPRRLALDFRDLTDKGLAFDSVHGDFELRDGNAFTSNLLLRGPAAEIGIAGRTGLGSRDYDQTAVVTGNLGVSLPVAGTLAGGPVVGAAVLLFSQVFKEPLKGITRGYYRITGPWDDPVVERVDAADVKAAVTEK